MTDQTGTVSVELAHGEVVEAEVKRSAVARVTRIQVGVDQPLRVVVPAGASDEYAREALRAKSDWVRRKLRVVEETLAAPAALGLERPGVVWVRGQSFPVEPGPSRFAAQRDGVLAVPADPTVAEHAVKRWYRREARSYLSRLVAEEAERLGWQPASVAVRDQRTRWGSCSSSASLSLNWRLLMAPEDVARYVAIHELVHLRVPNHSKAFWRALAAACPDWQRAAAWLREHGNELRGYEPRLTTWRQPSVRAPRPASVAVRVRPYGRGRDAPTATSAPSRERARGSCAR